MLGALERFHADLESYESLLDHLSSGKTILSHNLEERDKLRETLVQKSGDLKRIIIELTAKQYVGNAMSGHFDIWSEAFDTTAYSKYKVALCRATVYNPPLKKVARFWHFGARSGTPSCGVPKTKKQKK